MHKRKKLKRKMKKRECQNGRQTTQQKQGILIKMENIRNVKESIRKYGINTVRSHNFLNKVLNYLRNMSVPTLKYQAVSVYHHKSL